ncbi:hypothetical protein [Streptomyces sp. NPDC058620]|uniref:hypothetical protein n=1 Tax=Streptomyces sp. NPDC058620 TaxID=3346560 RepID=UPI003652B067
MVITEGCANRPGGAQAKFLAEVGESEHNRNLTLTLQAFRDFQAGHQSVGPGARDLVSFFESVETELLQDTTGPQIKRSDQEVINLLSQRAGTLHLGIANYCWFIDPDKALCLKLGQTKDRSRPLAGMCDSARCPQATHHPCHRPVWASAAVSSRVFIGKISRSQKAEKARLTAEAERAPTSSPPSTRPSPPPLEECMGRISDTDRTRNEAAIRAAMDRLLRGELPPGGRCDLKTLAAEAGVTRTGFYPKKDRNGSVREGPYQHLSDEFVPSGGPPGGREGARTPETPRSHA